MSLVTIDGTSVDITLTPFDGMGYYYWAGEVRSPMDPGTLWTVEVRRDGRMYRGEAHSRGETYPLGVHRSLAGVRQTAALVVLGFPVRTVA